jgi:two-component system response regulator AtoC
MSLDADILVVDDERSVREGLCSALAQAGYRPRACESVASARHEVERCVPDCVLLDIRLKDGDGLQLLEELRATHTSLPVIIASAYGDSERTIHAVKHGAFDYVTKPFDLDALLRMIARAVRSAAPAPALPAHENLDARLLGSSPRMLPVWKAIGRAAVSDVPVLITGETGVGKELVARAIHDNSAHSSAPFVAVNIAALPEGLIESELFGHEKGAFTGALARREGRFESAAEGTLFLDEIGDLTIGLQTKLLRVLQDGVFERVGGQAPQHSKARVVVATSKPVLPSQPGASLREDLFYRLGVIAIEVPPLRDRRSDIPLLVQSFLARLPGPRRAISEAALAALSAHDWPGNVRELLHVLKRACIMSAAEVLDVGDFGLAVEDGRQAGDDDLDLHSAITKLERELIARALTRADGNRSEAARLLGIARPQLYAKMRELGVKSEPPSAQDRLKGRRLPS